MKWKKTRILVSVVLIVVLAYFSTISIKSVGTSDESQQENFDLLATSSVSNLEMMLSVFEARNADFASYGYYPQIYSGSLQATYYALYILDAIGKLGDIDQQAVINYILSFYNSSTSQFSDENSNRYLASKIPGRYYPLSTLLQVNCYAVLSLDILNSISSINIADMLTFIWNCYHPILHGFIGQPYDDSLEEGFKVPTADNTYYAVITLDTLGFDWNAPPQDRDDITAYIEGLQSLSSSTGFYNDKEGIFDSLMEIEPNQFASYYCLKTLETFGSNYVDIIDKLKFHQHLTALYHSEGGYFDLSDSIWTVNYSNIVATAMSLELSDVTGFDDFARSDVLDFLFNNRNYRGGWEASTSVKYHELIDTFQIVRSLSNTGDISQLSLSDKNEIGLFVDLFAQERGYSLLSEDYTSVDLLYSLVSSYDFFGKIGELNIQELYDLLLGTVVDFSGNYRFFACTGMDLTKVSFRSRPFNYYTEGHHEFVDEINSIRSHENLFKMLDSLKKIFKLNDFAALYDLNSVLQDVIDSQFLDPSYPENFGAFLVNNKMSSPEWKNDLIYLKYSYYAIQTMETISQYLGLGNVTSQYFIDLGFDITALGTYVARNIVETPTELFFDAKYTDSIEIALENLYYTIYTLNAIDQFTLDTEKINNFVLNHLNYSNAKNLYYSYKISECLDLDISFDVEQTHLLVQNIYSDTYKEFYISVERKELDHDVFLWLCEIAKNDDARLSASYYDTVGLGGNNLFSVELVNLILSDFGQYSTVKLESAQLGTILLDQLGNNTYQKEVHVPIDTANYPTVEGELCAYDGAIKKASVPFSFTTEFDSFFTNSTTKTESRIVVTIEGYHAFISGNEPIYGSMYANVYRDGDFVDVIDLVTFHDLNRSIFTFDYPPSYFGNYSFDFYLIDPYFAEPQFVCSETFDIEFVMHFSHSVIKTETRIKVIFEGYHESDSGYQPIYSGSMYADVYRNGSFEDTFDLSTLHYLLYSTFTFDFTPEFYANFSFEFYLNYPYFTEPLFICNESFSTEYELKFVPSIIKNESCIWGAIEGYREFEHGQTPVYNGSMYANIYNNGFFVETIDLLTNHTMDRSIFTFDYTPEFYAYYSFEFYFYDPYLANPQLICNATFEYRDLNNNLDPYTEFTHTVIKTESRIEVSINGHYVFVSGNEPIFGGSMYAYIYLDGNYMDVFELVTFHDLNQSTFTFDYSPVYFGNYSFDFYLNDPYLANPQLICNATFEYRDLSPDPEPDPYTEFTHTVIKTESRIEVSINGYYVFASGNESILDGSMYAVVYRDGNYVDVIDLLASHIIDQSTFTFDYSPIYFGNYSFDFYLNDPYLANPQLVCNATFEYRDLNNNTNPDPDPTPDPDDPDPDPDPNPPDDLNDLYEGDAVITLPLAFGMVGAGTVPILGTYKTLRSKKTKNKQPSKK